MSSQHLLDQVAQAIATRQFGYKLLYPSVLIRVLPKPDNAGSLYIPTQYRNKPVAEGVVLQTWTEKRMSLLSGREIILTPCLKFGDIVLFPAWSGQPVPGWNEDDYRIVPDKHLFNRPGNKEDGAPFLVLDTERPSPMQHLEHCGFSADQIATIMQEFDIMPKHSSASGYVEPIKPGK